MVKKDLLLLLKNIIGTTSPFKHCCFMCIDSIYFNLLEKDSDSIDHSTNVNENPNAERSGKLNLPPSIDMHLKNKI